VESEFGLPVFTEQCNFFATLGFFVPGKRKYCYLPRTKIPPDRLRLIHA
jgi:hypothetical protein